MSRDGVRCELPRRDDGRETSCPGGILRDLGLRRQQQEAETSRLPAGGFKEVQHLAESVPAPEASGVHERRFVPPAQLGPDLTPPDLGWSKHLEVDAARDDGLRSALRLRSSLGQILDDPPSERDEPVGGADQVRLDRRCESRQPAVWPPVAGVDVFLCQKSPQVEDPGYPGAASRQPRHQGRHCRAGVDQVGVSCEAERAHEAPRDVARGPNHGRLVVVPKRFPDDSGGVGDLRNPRDGIRKRGFALLERDDRQTPAPGAEPHEVGQHLAAAKGFRQRVVGQIEDPSTAGSNGQ